MTDNCENFNFDKWCVFENGSSNFSFLFFSFGLNQQYLVCIISISHYRGKAFSELFFSSTKIKSKILLKSEVNVEPLKKHWYESSTSFNISYLTFFYLLIIIHIISNRG